MVSHVPGKCSAMSSPSLTVSTSLELKVHITVPILCSAGGGEEGDQNQDLVHAG